MRIIAGRYKGRRLVAPAGGNTRPIHDRAREALFSILAPEIHEALFLDCYAGTGSVGLEALSRGALESTFVESAHPALAALRENIKALGVDRGARVIPGEVIPSLHRLVREQARYDIAFLGPPYRAHVDAEVFECLALLGRPLTIVQHSPKHPNFTLSPGWEIFREKRYGQNALTFLAHLDGPSDSVLDLDIGAGPEEVLTAVPEHPAVPEYLAESEYPDRDEE